MPSNISNGIKIKASNASFTSTRDNKVSQHDSEFRIIHFDLKHIKIANLCAKTAVEEA